MMAKHFITLLMSTVWGCRQGKAFVCSCVELGEKEWGEGEGNLLFICHHN